MSLLLNIKRFFGGHRFKSKYEKKFLKEWLVTAAITSVTLVLFVSSSFFSSAGNFIYDRIELSRYVTPSKDIVIIGLDDNALSELGGWPLSRHHYTDLLKRLADTNNQPTSIAFDILFLDATSEDQALAAQMKRHHVVLPLEFRYQPDLLRKRAVFPVAPIQAANPEFGHIQISYDADGLIRGAQLRAEGARHFALAMLDGQAFGARTLGEQGLSKQNRAKKFSDQKSNQLAGYQRFPMVNPRHGFTTYSLAQVLSQGFPLAQLKDKYVLIGAMAPSLGDRYPTIYSGINDAGSPGVEIHASLLNALIQDGLIKQAPAWQAYVFSVAALLVVLAGLLVLSPAGEMALTLLTLVLSLIATFILLRLGNVWLNPLPVLLVIVLVKPVWAWRRMEIITHFMQEKADDLNRFDAGQRALPESQKKSAKSSFVQYTQMLTEAIESAHERLNFLALVISEIPEAVLIADESGNIMRHNQKMEAIFRLDDMEDRSIKHVLRKLAVFSDEKITELMDRLYSEERFAALDKDGALREFRMRILPLPIGAATHWRLMMMVDITDLVNLQKQRDRTLAILTHDMRTPVASILAVCRNASENAVNLVENVQKHAHFLLSMMDDFILSIRAESDKYRIEETLIETLMDEAIYQVKELMLSRGMSIQYQANEPVFLSVDGRLMTRVLVNLLGNAIRYGEAGSQVKVQYHVSPERSVVTLVIANIVGNHSAASNAPEQKGFGMGLDFIQTVIKKHNGYFRQTIPSHSGEEARVEIDLPCILLS